MKELRLSREEVERLVAKATPGPWNWVIEDYSMASLGQGDAPGNGTRHVLTVSPCNNCLKHAKLGNDVPRWEWGRCHTPSLGNAQMLEAAPSMAHDLLTLHARLREAERERADYRALAKELSDALITVRPLGGSELFRRRHGDEFYADPDYCRRLIQETRDELHRTKCRLYAKDSTP